MQPLSTPPAPGRGCWCCQRGQVDPRYLGEDGRVGRAKDKSGQLLVPHSPVPSWALPLPCAASSQYPLEGPLCDSPSWGKHLQLQPALATGCPQGQGMLRLEGSLKFISFQTPPMLRDISHYTRILQAPTDVVLNTSRDGATSYSPAVGKMSSSSQGNLRWDRDAVGHWWVGWRIGRAPRGAERPLPE